jgi:IQ calmodulin-binding motif
MTQYEVKLAIINGYKVFELATLNLPFHDRNDLLECVDNIEQIRPALNSLREASKLKQQLRAAILLQSLLRRYKAMKEFRLNKARHWGATVIQSRIRLFLVDY